VFGLNNNMNFFILRGKNTSFTDLIMIPIIKLNITKYFFDQFSF
jgi:hypothetical protein